MQILRKCMNRIFRLALLFFVLTTICIVTIYYSNTALTLYLKLSGILIRESSSTFVEQTMRWPLMLNPKILLHQHYLSTLPKVALSIENAAIDSLDQTAENALKKGFLSKDNNVYVTAVLYSAGQENPVQIRIHGSTKGNFNGLKKSLAVRFRKINERKKLPSFNLVNPKQHNYLVPVFGNYIAKELGLIFNEQQLVNLEINNASYGAYWKEEIINKYFLINRNLNAAIIKLKDNWIENAPAAGNFALQEISGLKKIKQSDSPEILNRYAGLSEAVDSCNWQSVLSYFDLDYMAKYEAYRCLFGVCHDVMWENLKLIYKYNDRRFYPVIRVEGDLNRISFTDGSLLTSYNSCRFLNLDKDVLMRAFIIMENSPDFRQRKFKALSEIIEHFPVWEQNLTQEMLKYENAVLYDPNDAHSVREKQYLFSRYFDIFRNNLNCIKQQLNMTPCYINLFSEKDKIKIEVIPDTEVPLKFRKFSLNLDSLTLKVNKFYISGNNLAQAALIADEAGKIDIAKYLNQDNTMPYFNNKGKLQKKISTFFISISRDDQPTLESFAITMDNAATGESLPENLVNIAVASENE